MSQAGAAPTGEIAHIIPTFERPRVCQRLVDSINHFYPESRIYVCDDSREPSTYSGAVDIPATAYDIGLSAKRNLLVQSTEEPLVMLWDDDYVCTCNTDLSVFYRLIEEVEGCGVAGAEWCLGREGHRRRVWFSGRLIPNGAEVLLRPPEGQPEHVSTEAGSLSYHEVDILPNWFMARRETLEAIPWDEELKLNEHLEFFARMAAARAEGSRQREWRDRWQKRSRGEQIAVAEKEGREMIQARASFNNAKHLAHLGGGMSQGDIAEVDAGYAEQLFEMDLAVPLSTVRDTRPFPIPEGTDQLDLKCVLTPDTTARHLREEGRASETYTQKRFRRDQFMPLQWAKLGVRGRDLVQWTKYPYGSPDFDDPDPQHLELPPI